MPQLSYLSQESAIQVDEELMGPLGFSIDQLMELAGLSVASAIYQVYSASQFKRVLVICGPGNNGGDGLVAARHLHHFGYQPAICYPKRTNKPLYHNLVTQLESLSVKFVEASELSEAALTANYDLIVDAIFGFSFQGPPREPFKHVLDSLASVSQSKASNSTVPPVVSIDVPSGWNVEQGDTAGTGFMPDMLVSLTAPKSCARGFAGPHHFLGGRFVPPAIAARHSLSLPSYPGSDCCVRVSSAGAGTALSSVQDMRQDYSAATLDEADVLPDPLQQFAVWFEEAVACGAIAEPNAMSLSTVDAQGRPSSRMVLLKGVDAGGGFTWFSNYGSRKGAALAANPQAALLFFWEALQRQVRVEGPVSRLPAPESDAYFASRPRGSQLGAHASPQSSAIAGRHVLEEVLAEVARNFPEGSAIPRPDNWGGYRLAPHTVEFWQGRKSRLHDRVVYRLQEDGSWALERLAP